MTIQLTINIIILTECKNCNENPTSITHFVLPEICINTPVLYLNN